jgi:hypothetical protein
MGGRARPDRGRLTARTDPAGPEALRPGEAYSSRVARIPGNAEAKQGGRAAAGAIIVDQATNDLIASRRLRKRLRTIGAAVLAVGLLGALLFYWIVSRTAGPTMEELMPGYAKMESRQMGILFGGTGVLLSEWLEDLKRPDTQAVIIALVAILIACGCFYVARLLEADELPADEGPAGP